MHQPDEYVILAIDPGPLESAFVLFEPRADFVGGGRVLAKNKVKCEDLLLWMQGHSECFDRVAIEMIQNMGMPAGAPLFETCTWIGKFEYSAQLNFKPVKRLYRKDIKLHLCGNTAAKNQNVRQSLLDRFGPGKEKAIGLKATPGPLYGFSDDMWSALAVAITAFEGE